ncbi:peroxiredoxin [Dyadobacter sp. BE34]|uniref:Peroxiredoxin n=1 Tax=Dyadobacter fermentans TaxID=94254 RepID=A0ABU1R8H7_9BACT|nr:MULTISPECIES: TlpA disulfide reductase family protein [Dyadobacter]MDR6809668.1 peroxiredoxin [Dyadobacter fermentans]MDR7047346.1 peroxiredoxin [Dyadobacter sp. BE242]MDR7201581.1 peroxiredoxin [Dyadobacter sp. BE34]MDR7219451.1 peroxiredoxin [Dyadobacter sp. BE31]MDR7267154.1 peroxiredoxin [Dyadobacter sp. BE32]
MRNLFLATLLIGLNGIVFASKMNLTVTYDQAKASDSLFLEYHGTFFPQVLKPHLLTAVRRDDGTYRFSVDIEGPVRFSILKRIDESLSPSVSGITFSHDIILYEYYWQGEGDLTIDIKKRPGSAPQNNQPDYDFAYTFQGYRAQQHRAKALSDSAFHRTGSTRKEQANYLAPQAKKIRAGIAVLDSFKPVLTDGEYQLLKADIIYKNPLYKLRDLRVKLVAMSPEQKADALAQIDKYFDWGIDPQILAKSRSYLYYWFERWKLGQSSSGNKFDADALLDSLLVGQQSLLADRKITYVIALGQVKSNAYYLAQARGKIQDLDCINVLTSMDVRAEGKEMFDFELQNTSGKLVKLSDFKGKTVLIDFWYTGCGGCEQYYGKVLSNVEKELHGKDIEFISISMDRGKERWMKSIKSNQYTSEHATNLYTGGVGFRHEVATRYGISSFPTLIVVDKEGKIADFDSKDLHVLESDNLTAILKTISTR